MTAIVGVVEGGRAMLGADSVSTLGPVELAIVGSKLARVGPLVVGMCGLGLAADALAYRFEAPPERRLGPDAYVYGELAPALRRLFAAEDLLERREPGNALTVEASLLVGYRGRLYFVASDLSVTKPAGGAFACGSGGEVALGALWATRGRPARERMRVALEAAATYVGGVGRPFRFLEERPRAGARRASHRSRL